MYLYDVVHHNTVVSANVSPIKGRDKAANKNKCIGASDLIPLLVSKVSFNDMC